MRVEARNLELGRWMGFPPPQGKSRAKGGAWLFAVRDWGAASWLESGRLAMTMATMMAAALVVLVVFEEVALHLRPPPRLRSSPP